MSNPITSEAVASLAAKLGELELSDDERRVLDALLERAAQADADVEGFGFDVGSLGFDARIADAAGFGPRHRDAAGFKGSDEELQAIVDWPETR